jgi:hypothetical protein
MNVRDVAMKYGRLDSHLSLALQKNKASAGVFVRVICALKHLI